MLLQETPTITYTTELEMARVLFFEGSYDAVLEIVNPITERDDVDALTKFGACQLRACVHSERQEWIECLNALLLSGPILDELSADLRAKYYGQRALAHRNLNDIGAALIDYAGARSCALEMGDELTEADVKNNLAKVYSDDGQFDEAILNVDAAIKIATRYRDDTRLGRYFDMKAQVFVAAKRCSEALTYSKKAISLLVDHPAGVEARWTHGLAMIGAGVSYLDQPKSVEQFSLRHRAAKLIDVELNVEILKAALKRANGHVLGAAKLLDISHSAVIKLVKKHELERVAKRRRNKPLIAK